MLLTEHALRERAMARKHPPEIFSGHRYCRICKTVMSGREGGMGKGPFNVPVLCCPDCLSGFRPEETVVVRPRSGRNHSETHKMSHRPLDPAALAVGIRGKRFDPRPQLTAATAVRISRETQTMSALLPNYRPPSRFRVA
jgi:hypothetical protein